MATKIAEQKELTFLQAGLVREAQANLEVELTRKTKKEIQGVSEIAQQAQSIAQQSVQTASAYETQMTEMKQKMAVLEQLLVQQRKKRACNWRVSFQQCRIGLVERKEEQKRWRMKTAAFRVKLNIGMSCIHKKWVKCHPVLQIFHP